MSFIKVNNEKVIEVHFEYVCYQLLKSHQSMDESTWHHHPLIQAFHYFRGCLLRVLFDLHLVAQLQIQFDKVVGPQKLINQVFNP